MMSHLFRFFVPERELVEGRAALPPAEVHHALHVVRVQTGDRVEVFDGAGKVGDAVVTDVRKRSVEVEVSKLKRAPEPKVDLTIVQGNLQREEAIESLIRRGADIGVSAFRFFKAERSSRAPRVKEKWTQWAIDSCKQSKRAWLPRFETADGLDDALGGSFDRIYVATRVLTPKPIEGVSSLRRIAVIIGPEGDFSDAELQIAASRNAIALSLGDMTLRSEVAAQVAATLILYECGAIGGPKL